MSSTYSTWNLPWWQLQIALHNWFSTLSCDSVETPFNMESTSSTSNKSTTFAIGCSTIHLSSLLPLLSGSNFTFWTTLLSSEFARINLHMGQRFCVVKPVFSCTMSPMQKFPDIWTHYSQSSKVLINSFLH